MQEVTVDIMFSSPCLGANRSEDGPVKFDRAGDDVIISPAAWRNALELAAGSIGIPVDRVIGIRIDPCIKRRPGIFKRYYRQGAYTEHEAYNAGTYITVNALIPPEVNKETFIKLLENIGVYWGISPYGWRMQGFGRFKVMNHDM